MIPSREVEETPEGGKGVVGREEEDLIRVQANLKRILD